MSKGKTLNRFFIIVAISVALFFVFTGAAWWIYTTVAMSLFPDAPESITNPSFWVFAGVLILLNVVAGIFKGK